MTGRDSVLNAKKLREVICFYFLTQAIQLCSNELYNVLCTVNTQLYQYRDII